MGANAAIFGLLEAVLFRSLPVHAPDRLVLFQDGIWRGRAIGHPRRPDGSLALYTHPLYQRLRALGAGLEGVAAQDSATTASTVTRPGVEDGAPAGRAEGRAVSASFFGVVGVDASRGRTFTSADETAAGANPVVVLSDAYWRRRFGADPAIVGAHLTINGATYTVVGVAAPGFTGAEVGAATDFWVPLTMQPQLTRAPSLLADPHFWWLHLIGRLAPGQGAAAAEAAANAVLRQVIADDAQLAKAAGRAVGPVRLLPGATGMSAARLAYHGPLVALMAGVGLLLLIVCLNLGHLLLARASARRREMGIRAALGASRGRLMRPLLVEGLVLSLAGAALAALVARWLGDGLLRLATDGPAAGTLAPLALDAGPDAAVLGFLALLAVPVTVALGLLPAWTAARSDPSRALSAGGRLTRGSRQLANRLLITSQVAFSVVLLAGAALLAGTLDRLRRVDPGLDVEHVLLADIDPHLDPHLAGLAAEAALPFQDELVRRLTALPGVRDASLSYPWLLSPARIRWGITFPGTTARPLGVDIFVVTPRYFDTLGIPFVAGRALAASDRRGPRVAVVNEALVNQGWPGAAGLGRVLHLMDVPGDADIAVAGIVRDGKSMSLRERPRPTIYLPAGRPTGIPGPAPDLRSLEVRAAGDPARLAADVRRILGELEPGLPVLSVHTLHTQVERTLVQERLLATLAAAFAGTALLLVMIGLHGVVSQWASRRTAEIGVRMALGAGPARVRWLVLRQAVLMVALGTFAGIPAAMAGARLLRGLLFGIEPADPAPLAAAALALFGVAVLAAYLPARRASRLDPMAALRVE